MSEPGHPEKQGEEDKYQHGLRSLLKSCIGSLSDLECQELGASQGVGGLQPWAPIISKEALSVGSREAVVELECLSLASFSLHQPFTNPLHPAPNCAYFFHITPSPDCTRTPVTSLLPDVLGY